MPIQWPSWCCCKSRANSQNSANQANGAGNNNANQGAGAGNNNTGLNTIQRFEQGVAATRALYSNTGDPTASAGSLDSRVQVLTPSPGPDQRSIPQNGAGNNNADRAAAVKRFEQGVADTRALFSNKGDPTASPDSLDSQVQELNPPLGPDQSFVPQNGAGNKNTDRAAAVKRFEHADPATKAQLRFGKGPAKAQSPNASPSPQALSPSPGPDQRFLGFSGHVSISAGVSTVSNVFSENDLLSVGPVGAGADSRASVRSGLASQSISTLSGIESAYPFAPMESPPIPGRTITDAPQQKTRTLALPAGSVQGLASLSLSALTPADDNAVVSIYIGAGKDDASNQGLNSNDHFSPPGDYRHLAVDVNADSR